MSELRLAPAKGRVVFIRDNHVVIRHFPHTAVYVFRTLFVGEPDPGIQSGSYVDAGTPLGTWPGEPFLAYEDDYVTYATSATQLSGLETVGCIDIATEMSLVVEDGGVLGQGGGVLLRKAAERDPSSKTMVHDDALVTFMAAGMLVDNATESLYLAYDDHNAAWGHLLHHPAAQKAARKYLAARAACEQQSRPTLPLVSKVAAWLRALADRVESRRSPAHPETPVCKIGSMLVAG